MELIEKIIRTYKLTDVDPVLIYLEKGSVCIRFNSCVYKGVSMEDCLSSISGAFAGLYLDYTNKENTRP